MQVGLVLPCHFLLMLWSYSMPVTKIGLVWYCYIACIYWCGCLGSGKLCLRGTFFAWGLIEGWLSFILLHSFHMNATYSVGFPVHLNSLFRIRVHACHWALLTCQWQGGNQTAGTLFVTILLMHIHLTLMVNTCFIKEPNTSFIVKSLERSYWHV